MRRTLALLSLLAVSACSTGSSATTEADVCAQVIDDIQSGIDLALQYGPDGGGVAPSDLSAVIDRVDGAAADAPEGMATDLGNYTDSLKRIKDEIEAETYANFSIQPFMQAAFNVKTRCGES